MAAVDYQQLIVTLARDVVERAAPEELPLFPAISQAFFKRAGRVLKGQAAHDALLGIGDDDSTLLTHAALATVGALVQHLARQRQPTPRHEQLQGAFRRYRTDDSAAALTLSAADIAQIRELARRGASQFSLPQPQIDSLADAIVATLADAPSA
jgi:hypothetical protein